MMLGGRELQLLRPRRILNRERIPSGGFTGVSTDSRTIGPGNLFVALKGETFDGHDFLGEVHARGAAGAIVSDEKVLRNAPLMTLVLVSDTVKALGRLAANHRKKFSLPVIAVAGSNGKTTAKEMIAAVLGTRYSVLSTDGNLNNHIGVPHTLLRLNKDHDVAVVEIGTNHPGEIAYLCRMLNPTHGLITNIGREHLEFFKTVSGVAREEGALYRFIAHRKGGTAFVNTDDAHVVQRAGRVRKRISYGFHSAKASIRGMRVSVDGSGCASFSVSRRRGSKPFSLSLKVPGSHNAANALAAVAVGMAFDVPAKNIRTALAEFLPVAKRMEVVTVGGVTIFNDTYNANPDSVVAALRTLAGATVSGKRIAVLADMRELGSSANKEHIKVGAEAGKLGIDYLLTYGEQARRYHDEANVEFAVHYEQKNVLAEYLAELLTSGDAVLVKGSRMMKMEDVVTFLRERLRMQPVVPE